MSEHVHRERVRFRDCDAMGHVDDAVYSTYLEEGRIGVLGGLGDVILARVEIDFRAELRAGEEVAVRTRCQRVGPAPAPSRRPSRTPREHAPRWIQAEPTSADAAVRRPPVAADYV